jgi:hypothetical protein
LLKTLDTEKLSEVVTCIEATPLEMNLALWDAETAGEIELDQEKDHIKLLTDAVQPWHNPELTNKLIRTIQHYAQNETNITRGRMNSLVKDPVTNTGYLTHEYIMSMQYLIDEGQVTEEIISVPKTGKRPFHKFVFIGLPENAEQNPEWNAKAVNKWIDDFAKNAVK